ncbi:MAG: SMP-30/gluconolactonase/LRE family protein [Solirubrobacteraceae bacterium]
MTPRLDVVADGFAFLEMPRWHRGRLWAADLYGGQVVCFAPTGAVELTLDVPGTPVGFDWAGNGRLRVLTTDGRLLDADGTRLTERDTRIAFGPAPCSEMTVDAAGGAYVGIFGLTTGALARVEPDGSTAIAAEGLLLPNGQAVTADGRTLIVAESAGQRLTAFTIGPGGSLTDRREWARLGPPATATTLPEVLAQVAIWPDGIALDAAGAAWVANPFGNEALRVVEGGAITHRISTGALGCFACALGGDDGRALFLCAAPPSADEAARRAERSSKLLACRVDVPAARPQAVSA